VAVSSQSPVVSCQCWCQRKNFRSTNLAFISEIYSFIQSFGPKGFGTALMTRLIEIAKERNYGRVKWAVFDWSERAIKFYTEKIGAKLMSSWRICRLLLE
jgi:GNAT superfamily N-acetyltransferase